jgi:predicted permease
MDTFLQDVKYALRMLIKKPGFTVVAVLTLALGVGANTTIFTLINAIFLNPLPVRDVATLADVYTRDAKATFGNVTRVQTSYLNFQDYAKQNDVFEAMTAYQNLPLTLSGRGEPQQLQGFVVTANYFDVLGVKTALGRTFLPEEDENSGAHPVVVVSYSLWAHKFGMDPGLIGQTLTINGQPMTVIGIAPKGFKGTFVLGQADQFWVPLSMHKQLFTGLFEEFFESRRALLMNITGRLKPGVSVQQAQSQLQTIAARLEKEYPVDNGGRTVEVDSTADGTVGIDFRKQFLLAGGVLMSVAGMVLLIACVNLANLLLVRASTREKEISIRTALGASRVRLLRQLLTESVVLALLGGIAGLLLAYWGRDVLWSFRPPFLDQTAVTLTLDARVLSFTFGIALLTGLIFGLMPALRGSSPDINEALKVGGRQGGSWGHNRLRQVLVITELALALVALVGAGLFVRSMQEAQRIDPGFESKNLAVLGFDLGGQHYSDERGKQFYRELMEKARTVPGVESATVASNFPLGGGLGRSIFPEGSENDPSRRAILVTTNMVAPNYFETLRIPLVKGRVFTDFDTEKTTPVAIINEAMAKKFWPGEDPIGKRYTFFQDPVLHEVVGVVKNSVINAIGEDPQPQVYLPVPQYYQAFGTLQVRTAGNPSAVIATVRSTVQQLDRNLPLVFVQTIGDVLDQGLWAPRMGAALLSLFGFLSLGLAAVGVYGVMSYSVSQRTQEFGIRMALGAEARNILRLVVTEGLWLAGIGFALGIVAAAFLARLLTGLLFGVKPGDLETFGGVSMLLATVAGLACYVPARRATRVDPLVALRYE